MRAFVVAALCVTGCSSVPAVTLHAAESKQPAHIEPAKPAHIEPAKRRSADLPDSAWRVIAAEDLGNRIDSRSEFCRGESQRSDGRFIAVHYAVTNRSDEPEQSMSVPTIVDDRGRSFMNVNSEFCYVPEHAKMLGFATLEPNASGEFWTIIEVPANARELRIHVKGFRLVSPEADIPLDMIRD